MKTLFLVLLTVLSSAGAIALSPAHRQTTTDGPQVVSAEAPRYPPLARATRIEGETIVKVEIDARGRVTSATKVSGSQILYDAGEKAAKAWQFAPAESNGVRTAELSFVFLEADKGERPLSNSTVIYFPPYKVEVQYHADGTIIID